MNPIFGRRHRTGNNSTNTQNSSRKPATSPSKQKPESDFVVEPLIPPENLLYHGSSKTKIRVRSPEEIHIHKFKSDKSTGRLTSSKSLSFHSSSGLCKSPSPSPVAESSKSFAQTLFESRQNMLAHVSLTPKENRQRQALNEGSNKSSTDPEKVSPSKTISIAPLALCDIEDEDFGLDCVASGFSDTFPRGEQFINTPRYAAGPRKTLDLKTWKELKNTVLGAGGILQAGWIGQGFSFDSNIPYGIVQKKGGPCGVLAVIQSLTLRNLIFGSEYCDDGLPVEIEESGASSPTSGTSEFSFAQNISSKRTIALCGAIVEVLWKCSHGGDTGKNKPTKGKPAECIVCFSGTSVGDDMRVFNDMNELKQYILPNLYRMDCVGLVYSAILSRGLEQVQGDMDFPDSPLLGQHGYCSQELVNLLLLGKAISNSFDNQVLLGDKVLQGIESQSDVGLLSLFEHYDSCQVGSYLKCPKYPVWIVCSESHFSILFAADLRLTTDVNIKNFDLYYYDGLACQQNIVKLSISFQKQVSRLSRPSHFTYGLRGIQLNNNQDCDYQDEDLIPPLEKCIRTKWKGAVVDWNGSEPIL